MVPLFGMLNLRKGYKPELKWVAVWYDVHPDGSGLREIVTVPQPGPCEAQRIAIDWITTDSPYAGSLVVGCDPLGLVTWQHVRLSPPLEASLLRAGHTTRTLLEKAWESAFPGREERELYPVRVTYPPRIEEDGTT